MPAVELIAVPACCPGDRLGSEFALGMNGLRAQRVYGDSIKDRAAAKLITAARVRILTSQSEFEKRCSTKLKEHMVSGGH
jgi:hypothetical protein